MARRRMIKPEFFTDEKVISLPIPARLLFIGMWNHADDEGIFKDSPIQLKVQVFPADESIDLNVIKNYIDLMITQKLLIPGLNVDDGKLLKITKWHDHQTINRPTPSKYIFTPINEDSLNTHTQLNDNSMSNHTQLIEDSLPSKDKIKEDKLKEDKIKVKENSSMSKTDKLKEEFTFDKFISLYPRKIRQQMASNSFKKIAAKHLKAVFDGLDAWNKYWTDNAVDVEYIPYPSTWLNQKQWEDKVDVAEKPIKFKSDLDEEIHTRNHNIALESKRMKRHLEEAANDAVDVVPNLLSDFKRNKKNNAQPIKDIIEQMVPNTEANTHTDGK